MPSTQLIRGYIPPESLEEQWDIQGLEKQLQQGLYGKG